MSNWISLFLYSKQTRPPAELAEWLNGFLSDHQFTAYDAFGIIPGPSYPHTLKIFIIELNDHWQRLAIETSDITLVTQLAAALSSLGMVVQTAVFGEDEDDALPAIALYQEGASVDLAQLATLIEGAESITAETIKAGARKMPDFEADKTIGGIATSQLPGEIQEQAKGTNSWLANALFNKVSRSVMGGEDTDNPWLQVEELWNSGAGKQIRYVMEALKLDSWREPDFTTIRHAYGLHKRRSRKPDAPLLPGDQTTLDAVPNALDMTPVYGGKR